MKLLSSISNIPPLIIHPLKFNIPPLIPISHNMNAIPPTVQVDNGDYCSLCWTPFEDATINYRTSVCHHLYCHECMSDSRLTECVGCTRPFDAGEPVVVRVVYKVD